MSQYPSDKIKFNIRSKLPSSKNFQKANDIISKATTSYNFYKSKNKNDIMEKITYILNDKEKQENFDSCYLNGKNNNLIKNSEIKINNNKNEFLKSSLATDNQFYKPEQDINFHVDFHSRNNKFPIGENKHNLKNERIKVLSPKKAEFKINFFDKFSNRDFNMDKIQMHFASGNLEYKKNENKIFSEKVKNEINTNKSVKNNFKLFYDQLNSSKSKIKRSDYRESIDSKDNINKENGKLEELEKCKIIMKNKDSESQNLFLTKFNMKLKNNLERFGIYSICKDNNENDKKNSSNYQNFQPDRNQEIFLGNEKKEIDQNVSKSIDFDNDDNYSYYSLKNEFSFLLGKKGESEVYNLRDMINDVKIAQNKLSSEYNDIKNLLKFANDTRSKLQMHKTENKFFNVKNKLNNDKGYSNKNRMINGFSSKNNYYQSENKKNLYNYLKNGKNFINEKDKNIDRDDNKINASRGKNEIGNLKININNNNPIKKNNQKNFENQNCVSVDEYLLLADHDKNKVQEEKNIFEVCKKVNKKRSLTEINYKVFFPKVVGEKIEKIFTSSNIQYTNTLTSKNKPTSLNNVFNINNNDEEENHTNNYYVIKSNLINNKNNEKENLNVKKNNYEEFIFDPADIEVHQRHSTKNLKIENFSKSVDENGNLQDMKNREIDNPKIKITNKHKEEFKYDNNKNIFDREIREIKTIYNLGNKKYFGNSDKINIEKFHNLNTHNKNYIEVKTPSMANKNEEKMKIKFFDGSEEIKTEENLNDHVTKFKRNVQTKNFKHFNEMKNNGQKKNYLFESLDEKHKFDDIINKNVLNNQIPISLSNKFYGSSSNFHRNKTMNIDSIEKMNNENNIKNTNTDNKKKHPKQQPLILKEMNSNPFGKNNNKNFVDKKNFLEHIKKNPDFSNNKLSFEKKVMSKTNYNFAEFMKNNTDKKNLNSFNKNNIKSKEKLLISAETNFISKNLLNDGYKAKINRNYLY